MSNIIVANIASFLSKAPDRKDYYKKFEGNVPRNTEIPDGRFEVTVNYNSVSNQMKVTQILHDGKSIAIREGYNTTLVKYDILDDYFQSIYDRITPKDRQEYTNTNINELEKLKGSYQDSLSQIEKKVHELNESILKPNSSLYAIIQRLFENNKTIDLHEDIGKFNDNVKKLLIKENVDDKNDLIANFKKYYDEKINVLIVSVTAILQVQDKVKYTATMMSDLIDILDKVIGILNKYREGTIDTKKFDTFKKIQQ